MWRGQNAITVLCLLLCACANNPVVTGDSRGFFDTAKGMYGGNEFDARSTEGKITVANEPQAAASTPVAVGTGSAAKPSTAGEAPISIDANAFAAVFGSVASPVKPSADQLMQLDSVSLVAADAARLDLQQKILACRRAGEACRLAHQ